MITAGVKVRPIASRITAASRTRSAARIHTRGSCHRVATALLISNADHSHSPTAENLDEPYAPMASPIGGLTPAPSLTIQRSPSPSRPSSSKVARAVVTPARERHLAPAQRLAIASVRLPAIIGP